MSNVIPKKAKAVTLAFYVSYNDLKIEIKYPGMFLFTGDRQFWRVGNPRDQGFNWLGVMGVCPHFGATSLYMVGHYDQQNASTARSDTTGRFTEISLTSNSLYSKSMIITTERHPPCL